MMSKQNVPELRFPGFSGEWEERKIKDITSSFSGGTPTSTQRSFYNGDIPFIRSGEVSKSSTELKINEEALKASSAKLVKKGDLLVAMYGATSGEASISKINGAINQAVLCLRSKESNEFLYYYLKKQKERIVKKYLQGGQGNLSASIIKSISVYLPSENEQLKIGELFKTLDRLIELEEKKLELLEAQKKGYMQKIFSQELRFKDENGNDYPEWEKTLVGNVMEVSSFIRVHQKDWTEEGVPFYRARDIVAFNKGVNFTPLHITQELYAKNINKSGKVKSGDVMITGVGTIGVPFLIEGNEDIYFKDANVIWLKNNNKLNGWFLYYYLTSHDVQKFISRVSGLGTVGTYTIDSARKTPLLIPQLEEQRKIGDFFSKLENLEKFQKLKIDKLKKSKKSLLSKLFL